MKIEKSQSERTSKTSDHSSSANPSPHDPARISVSKLPFMCGIQLSPQLSRSPVTVSGRYDLLKAMAAKALH